MERRFEVRGTSIRRGRHDEPDARRGRHLAFERARHGHGVEDALVARLRVVRSSRRRRLHRDASSESDDADQRPTTVSQGEPVHGPDAPAKVVYNFGHSIPPRKTPARIPHRRYLTPVMEPHALRADLYDPAALAALAHTEVVARGILEGFLRGLHRPPRKAFWVR